MTFWTRLSKVMFPKRSAEMINASEKRKRHLAFEFQSSRVFEEHSNGRYFLGFIQVYFVISIHL